MGAPVETIRVISRFRPINARERAIESADRAAPRFSDDGRSVWVQVHRPKQRPSLLASIYAHANDLDMRDVMIHKQSKFARASKEIV